jgi:DNA-binding MarR family transcriptional regulator
MATSKNEVFSGFMSAMVRSQQEFKSFLRNKFRENDIDLTFEMLQVLKYLWNKEGVNQQELANMLHKDKASLTYLIDNLSKRSLVLRTEDPSDRRNKIITLLPEGLRLKGVIQPWIDEMITVAGKNINTELLQNGKLLFEKIYTNLRRKAASC